MNMRHLREVSATIFHCLHSLDDHRPAVDVQCLDHIHRNSLAARSHSYNNLSAMKQIFFLLLAGLAVAEIQVSESSSLDSEPLVNLPEEDVRIIPTHIDIVKLREAYATVNAGERFLPAPSRLPIGLLQEQKRK
ncbi:hypothetical protein RB195_008882 [Necator americanus]